jgi:hypothetical protein
MVDTAFCWELIGKRGRSQYNGSEPFRPLGPEDTPRKPVPDQAAAATVPLEEVAARPRERAERETKRQPPYHVVLWNDDDHSYEYVILMLLGLFGYQP